MEGKMDKKIKVKYALEFAKLSYSLEEKRETNILKNAERLILSCLTISVIAFFNFKALSENGIDINANIVFVTTLLIVSFISSVLSQRRIPYETMLIGDEFEEYLEKYKDDYNDESDYEAQMIIQLSNVQKSKKNNNDKRVFWVQQSTFFLVLSALSLFVLNVVALI